MQKKIEWYQEVLSLEPGSKVFFPLAKLFAEMGEPDRAIDTLRTGLNRHPDFLEARFMLVDLLVRQERDEEAREHIGHVTEPLAEHPAFWKLWAQNLLEVNRDLAVFLMLVASNLTGQEISWSDVVLEGLNNLSDRLVGRPASRTPEAASPAGPATADDEDEEPAVAPASGRERGGIRTRTMADLLASQGDYAGALDIYRELLSRSATPEEKKALSLRIGEMEALAGKAATAAPSATPPKEEDVFSKHAKNRLISTLEALASRFEARIRS